MHRSQANAAHEPRAKDNILKLIKDEKEKNENRAQREYLTHKA